MKTKNELIAEALAKTGKAGRIADIGFAQNPNLYLTGEIHGIDLVSAPVPRGYTTTHVVDLNTDSLPFSDQSMDAVTMGCTLAHVANPLRVLAEVNRVLKEGGVCIVSSPNPNYYLETAFNVFYRFFKNKVSKAKHVEHFFEFSRYNMRTIAERAGFQVTDEVGCTFAVVKTAIKFHPLTVPGLAYEIIYVLTKVGNPEGYATFEAEGRIEKVPARLFS